jgi:hypothetical protein
MIERKERPYRLKKGLILIFALIFSLMASPRSHGDSTTFRKLLNSPEEYEGQTFVFDKAMLGGDIRQDKHTGFFCLPVEIHNKYIPEYLYHSQLNFVITSPELANKVIAKFELHEEKAKFAGRLLGHMDRGAAYMVKLTVKVESSHGYWIANVSKLELYGKDGKIIATAE